MASSLASVTSGFFPSNNHDRLYTADQLANVISALISDGVVQSSSNDPNTLPFKVAFSGNDATAVTISKGVAWLNNTWTTNSAVAALSMSDTVAVEYTSKTRRTNGSSANASQPRWDAIAIEVNKTSNVRANTFVILEGVPGSNPNKPVAKDYEVSGEDRHYYTIAFLYRPAGSGATITNQTADKLLYAVGQNGGIPFVMSIAGAAVSIQDILNRYDDTVTAKIEALDAAITQAGQAQLADYAVGESKIATGAVTNSKIANGAVSLDKLNFTPIQPDSRSKVPAANASSALIGVSSNATLALTHAGCTINSTGTAAITVTIPSTVGFPVGTEIEFVRWGTGALIISSGSTSTRFFTTEGGNKTSLNVANQYGTIVIKQIATNNWLAVGDIG